MSWTLTLGATTKTLSEWGVSGLRRSRTSQAVDSLSFVIDGAMVDAEAPFDADDEISIAHDGTTWFRGRVVALRREATGSAERITYQVAGPWWYLERLVYQQPWAISGSSDVWKSHVLLNITETGTAWTTRDQIDDALDWCSDKATAEYGSAPFQWTKANLPAISIPIDEVRDITCAEVIRKQLRWIPDAVCWWDYSTSPPTFHCRRRADLDEVDVALGAPITACDFIPRYDLQVPAVALKFEQINTVDGAPIAAVTEQFYPEDATGEEFGALVATIDLAGGSISHATAYVRSSALPTTSTGWRDWLKVKHPSLASARVSITEVVSTDREKVGDSGADVLDYELLDGQVPDWASATAQHEKVSIRLRYTTTGTDGSTTVDVRDEVFDVNIVTTDAETQTFSMLASFEAGEDVPAGLAESLYDALSVLEWEGRIVTVEQEITGDITLGTKVNVTGGRTEWETMGAVVQSTDDDVDSGTSTIVFGPPQQLGPRDLVELLRVNRFRLRITPQSVRTTGTTSSGAIALGNSTPQENATRGLAERKFSSVKNGNYRVDIDTQSGPGIALTEDGTTVAIELTGYGDCRGRIIGPNGAIYLDTADLDGNTIQPREVSICVNGVQKKMIVLCSEPYDP